MQNNQPIQLEQLFRIRTSRRRFTLGMPVARGVDCPLTMLTPEGVAMLVAQGTEVVIERGIGKTIQYEDSRYLKAGATIASRGEALGCDVVMYSGKLTVDEASQLKPHGVLLTLSDNRQPHPGAIKTILERRVTVLALDRVRDKRGMFPLADILGEVSGRAATATAASFLAHPTLGKGILLGGVAGINPCEVVILGTGMSALAAARSAIGLGGMVRLFDSDPYCLRVAMAELGAAVIGSALHPAVLGHALASADVVIATRLERHFSIDDSVLDSMKKGVVIFDLNDREGISPVFPTLKCVNVADAVNSGIQPGASVCLINPMGAVPRTAAMALTNDIVPVMERLFGSGNGILNNLKADPGLRNSVIFFRGHIVNKEMAERLAARWVDINLLLSFS